MDCKKSIIMAGGAGTRLHPMTQVVSKHLLPIYDKPMIYYPLSVLVMAGSRKILMITTPQDVENYRCLLGDGSHIGLEIEYAVQPRPEGIAQAFVVGRDFIGDSGVGLALGDNIFCSTQLPTSFLQVARQNSGAAVFTYPVDDPHRFGVIELDDHRRPVSIEEKPQQPRSNLALIGLYVYDNDAVEIAANLKPSARGELEISDLNHEYLRRGTLAAYPLERDCAWFDTGTPHSLLQASRFVELSQQESRLKIACLEEIALLQGLIDAGHLRTLAGKMRNEYGDYLLRRADEIERAWNSTRTAA